MLKHRGFPSKPNAVLYILQVCVYKCTSVCKCMLVHIKSMGMNMTKLYGYDRMTMV